MIQNGDVGGLLGTVGQGLADRRGLLYGIAANGFAGAQQGMASDRAAAEMREKQQQRAQMKQALTQFATDKGIDPAYAGSDEVFKMYLDDQQKKNQLAMQEKNLQADIAYRNASLGLQERTAFKPTFQERLYSELPTEEKPAARGALLGTSKAELTDHAKDYQYYARQATAAGQQPMPFDQFMQTVSRTPGVTVNTGQAYEKEEEKERGKSVTKFLGDVANQGPAIAQRSADLDLLGQIASKTPTGSGAQLRADLDGIGNYLGLSPGTLKTQADAINAATKRIAPSLRQPGSGSQSDADLAGFLQALPSMAASPAANALIQSTLQRAAAIDRERAEVGAKWQAGDINASEARRKILEIDRKSIYASDQERKIVEAVMGREPIAGGATGQAAYKILGVRQ